MCLYPRTIRATVNNEARTLEVGCGKCVECLSARAREWSFRLMHEATLHKEKFFLTLTYNEKYIPLDESVSRREIQLFLKRLRKHIAPAKIRYFACGEYGSKKGRPHYHLIVYGWQPKDLVFNREVDGVKYYTSATIEKLWGLYGTGKHKNDYFSFGFHLISPELTLDNTRYCAKYMQKLNKADNQGETPPFTAMSLRPGIGADAFDYNSLDSDKIYINGQSIHLPRYYLKLAEREGFYLGDLKDNRLSIAELQKRGFMVEKQTRKRIKEKQFKKI